MLFCQVPENSHWLVMANNISPAPSFRMVPKPLPIERFPAYAPAWVPHQQPQPHPSQSRLLCSITPSHISLSLFLLFLQPWLCRSSLETYQNPSRPGRLSGLQLSFSRPRQNFSFLSPLWATLLPLVTSSLGLKSQLAVNRPGSLTGPLAPKNKTWMVFLFARHDAVLIAGTR